MALVCPKCGHPLIKNTEQEQLPADITVWGKLKVLIHPRLIARQLVPQTSNQQALFWIGLAGATAIMADAIEPIINNKVNYQPFQTILVSASKAAIIGSLITIVIAFLLSFLIQSIGQYIGLMTTQSQIRALFAWSTPPIFLWAAALFSQWLVYVPNSAHRTLEIEKVHGISNFGLWWLTSGTTIITVLCFLMLLAFLIIGLAEIGKSLIWSSFATVLLTGIIIGGILMIIFVILSFLGLYELSGRTLLLSKNLSTWHNFFELVETV